MNGRSGGGRICYNDLGKDVLPFEFLQRKGTCETYTHEGSLLPHEGYGFFVAEIGEFEDELQRKRHRAT